MTNGASSPAAAAPNNEACASCHSDVAEKVKTNVHGAVPFAEWATQQLGPYTAP